MSLELNARGLGNGRGICNIKEVTVMEPELLGKHVVGEDLNLRVELPHATVVETARGLNFVFGVDKLTLQLQEVLAGM